MGRSKGGLSTKVHAAADALGNPIRFILTGGERNDITQIEGLLEGLKTGHVLADKGYDGQRAMDAIAAADAKPVVPRRKTTATWRTFDAEGHTHRSPGWVHRGVVTLGQQPGRSRAAGIRQPVRSYRQGSCKPWGLTMIFPSQRDTLGEKLEAVTMRRAATVTKMPLAKKTGRDEALPWWMAGSAVETRDKARVHCRCLRPVAK
ncbi:transposase [Mesorhizobium sp.]|uniref:transposase n=1 Tax=Mesorhizobium sp. TaxID=1871066 RepID=UPI0025C4E5C3|nr:transposase [Mesorhizobium sp.]